MFFYHKIYSIINLKENSFEVLNMLKILCEGNVTNFKDFEKEAEN